jgi:hypothetical protein
VGHRDLLRFLVQRLKLSLKIYTGCYSTAENANF